MIRIPGLLALALAASSCHDSSSGGATSFDATVTNLIQDGTDETSEPLEIDGTTFVFPAENAFDDVLPPDTGAVVPQ